MLPTCVVGRHADLCVVKILIHPDAYERNSHATNIKVPVILIAVPGCEGMLNVALLKNKKVRETS